MKQYFRVPHAAEMKPALLIGAAAVAMFIVATPARATMIGAPTGPDPFTLVFDENGNATVDGVSATGYIDSNGFLAYNLPSFVGLGDVAIADPGVSCTSAATCSDGLRFLNLSTYTGGSVMEFMSAAGGGALADTGFASDFSFGFVGATENADGAFSYLCGGNNCYEGTSAGVSAVPEPGSLALFGSGLLVLSVFAGWEMRRRRTG